MDPLHLIRPRRLRGPAPAPMLPHQPAPARINSIASTQGLSWSRVPRLPHRSTPGPAGPDSAGRTGSRRGVPRPWGRIVDRYLRQTGPTIHDPLFCGAGPACSAVSRAAWHACAKTATVLPLSQDSRDSRDTLDRVPDLPRGSQPSMIFHGPAHWRALAYHDPRRHHRGTRPPCRARYQGRRSLEYLSNAQLACRRQRVQARYAGLRIDGGQHQIVEHRAPGRHADQVSAGRFAGRYVDGGDPAAEGHRHHHLGRGGGEDLVQRAERDTGNQPVVALPDLAVLTWHRLDDVARMDVAVGADRGHDADRRKLGFHRDAPVLRLVGDLVLARKA